MEGYRTGRNEHFLDVHRLEREKAELAVELQSVKASFARYREDVKTWIRQTLASGLNSALDVMTGLLDEREERLMDDGLDPYDNWEPMEVDLLEELDDRGDEDLFPDLPFMESYTATCIMDDSETDCSFVEDRYKEDIEEEGMLSDEEEIVSERDWTTCYMEGYRTGRNEHFLNVHRLEREKAELAVELQSVKASLARYREDVKTWIRQTLASGLNSALDVMTGLLDEREERLMDDGLDPYDNWEPMEVDLLEELDDRGDEDLFPDLPFMESNTATCIMDDSETDCSFVEDSDKEDIEEEGMVSDEEEIVSERDWTTCYMEGYRTGRNEHFLDVHRLEREKAELAVELQSVKASFARYREDVKTWIRQTLASGLNSALDVMTGLLDEREERLMDDGLDPYDNWEPMEVDLLEELDDRGDEDLFPDLPFDDSETNCSFVEDSDKEDIEEEGMVSDEEEIVSERDWTPSYMEGYRTGRNEHFLVVHRLEREKAELAVELQSVKASFARYREDVKTWIRQTLASELNSALDAWPTIAQFSKDDTEGKLGKIPETYRRIVKKAELVEGSSDGEDSDAESGCIEVVDILFV
ncbi:hypothetical protein HOLleu_42478 [Holothuria leucospilota]|uniref:Uncharacterized protein n=1 Tax=Holothuria leucospilota TaxID=206669 RepID=A0A9Q0YCN1_HOLLE|nr:hypothetical protein HOLleu_42478 [Holothuria leucospilota]